MEKTEKTIFVKIISPNFDLKYGLNKKEIEDRMKSLIRYSDPEKDRQTLFVWPEVVFSGYSFDEILTFKNLISNNFSEKHFIIFGANNLEPDSKNFYNSMFRSNDFFRKCT